MNYCSRTTHESKTSPGVSFTLHKMNEKRRVTRELKVAELRVKIETQSAAIRQMLDKKPEAQPQVGIDKQNAELDFLIHAEWYPAWIRWGLHSIDGLDIDGVAATADSLIESGDPKLVDEIYRAIWKESGLGVEAEKNLQEPGISNNLEAGQTSNSTAPSASSPNGTATETAASTSPAT